MNTVTVITQRIIEEAVKNPWPGTIEAVVGILVLGFIMWRIFG